ncbi:MAG: Hint domain-containing protein [Rhodobacter sp.]|nr:Hint domain-containing protein [Rhodobacter sp.]
MPIIGQWAFEDSDGTGADTSGNGNTAAFADGAFQNTVGSAVFDGLNDYVQISDTSQYAVASATIHGTFTVATGSLDGTPSTDINDPGLQALVSRDSSGFDGGGHLTIYVDGDGSIFIRHQSDTQSYEIRTDPGVVSEGQNFDLVYAFSDTGGMVLYVDGVEVGSNTDPVTNGDSIALSGNTEPWTLGASQALSGDGVADHLQQFFEGSIGHFEIYDAALSPAELNVLHDLSDGVDDGLIAGTAGDDTIYGGPSVNVADGGLVIDDSITAGDGNDVVFAGDGNDTVLGGAGDDSIDGGTGNDYILGDAGNDTLDGGDGADTVLGGTEADDISGGSGADILYGNTGADTIDGGAGNDTIYLVGGDDSVTGGDDADYFAMFDGFGIDTIFGGEGGTDTDWIDLQYLTSAVNVTFAGDETGTIIAGPDVVSFSEVEWFSLTGQADIVSGAASTADMAIDAGGGNDTITTGSGDDIVLGGHGDDVIQGGQGNDTLDGGEGADTVVGGTQADSITGGTGDDVLYADAGTDTVVGGTGNDTIYVGGGDDTIEGGDDADQIVFLDGFGSDTVTGGEGGADTDIIDLSFLTSGVSGTLSGDEAGTITQGMNSVAFTEVESLILTGQADLFDGSAATSSIEIAGGLGGDTLTGGAGDDTITGGLGDDRITGGAGNDSLDGGDGSDTLVVSDGSGVDTFDGGSGSSDVDVLDFSGVSGALVTDASLANVGSDQVLFSEVEWLIGTDQSDTITFTGHGSAVTIEGGGGGDILIGGNAADALYGGAGSDSLYSINDGAADVMDGGEDSDFFYFYDGPGDDTVIGGGGTDRIDLTNLTGGVTLTYTAPYAGTIDIGSNTISFSEVEIFDLTGQADVVYGGTSSMNFYGGGGSDTLFGSTQNDGIHGGTGDDLITGGTGRDHLRGAEGDDTIQGGADGDWLYGGGDDDIVEGGSGDDDIGGDAGNDTLTGGAGDDTIATGAGDDLVILEQLGANDTVTDFDIGDTDGDGNSNDQLDVSDLRDLDGNPVNVWDVVVSDDGSGNALLTFPEGETLTLQGIASAQMTPQQMMASGIPCFTSGTMIMTPDGERPVDGLHVGDLVTTRDNGPQPVIWRAQRTLGPAELAARPDLRPVRLCASWTGTGRDLVVSRQHGIVASRQKGAKEFLVRAVQLARMKGGRVRIANGARKVTYVHLLLPRHEVVFANSVATESFYPGPSSLAMLAPLDILALVAKLPRLASTGAENLYGPPVLRYIRTRELPKVLADVHAHSTGGCIRANLCSGRVH